MTWRREDQGRYGPDRHAQFFELEREGLVARVETRTGKRHLSRSLPIRVGFDNREDAGCMVTRLARQMLDDVAVVGLGALRSTRATVERIMTRR